MKAEKLEIRLAGMGGQGLVKAGIILAHAAILSGLNSAQSQSYGPEARGGASRSDVIISKDKIDSPFIEHPDLLLAMTEEAYEKYKGGVKETGFIIADSTYVPEKANMVPAKKILLPLTEWANEEFQTPMVANVIAIGIINRLLDVFSEEVLERAICENLPEKYHEKNLSAFKFGVEKAKGL